MPHELSAFGIFFSPWLAAWAGACVLAPLVAWLVGALGWARWFRLPQWTFLGLLVCTACILFRWGV